jgi:hypothetical protein
MRGCVGLPSKVHRFKNDFADKVSVLFGSMSGLVGAVMLRHAKCVSGRLIETRFCHILPPPYFKFFAFKTE